MVGFWLMSGLRTFRMAQIPFETERVPMDETKPTPNSFKPPTTTAHSLVLRSKFSPSRALWKALSGRDSSKPLKPSRGLDPVTWKVKTVAYHNTQKTMWSHKKAEGFKVAILKNHLTSNQSARTTWLFKRKLLIFCNRLTKHKLGQLIDNMATDIKRVKHT